MGSGSDTAVSCGVRHRHGLDPAIAVAQARQAAAALIRPEAQGLPYATGAALKSKKQTNKKTGSIHVAANGSISFLFMAE